MGFHKTGDPAWGDTPSDILREAFEKINQSFKDEIGREVTRSDLVLGCFFSLIDRFPRKEHSPEVFRIGQSKVNVYRTEKERK